MEFAGHGLAGARMDAIAAAAGVNKALLYYYFRSKDELYAAVLDEFFQRLEARIGRALDSGASAGERVLLYARAHFDSVAESPYYARLFQGEMMSAGREGSPHLSHIVDQYIRPISLRVLRSSAAGHRGGRVPRSRSGAVRADHGGDHRLVLRGLSGGAPASSRRSVFPARPSRQRRAAVLDFIAAALFVDRRAGLKLAAADRSAAGGRRSCLRNQRARCRAAAPREAQVKKGKFFIFLLLLVLLATGYFFYSTDRTGDTVLIGIVDANQVIVSSKIAGRVEKLNVDEGSQVKAGDLIAEIDSAELEAQKTAAEATINAYNMQVASLKATESQTLGETNSGVVNAQALLAAAQATLAQAKADLARIQSDSRAHHETGRSGRCLRSGPGSRCKNN